MPGVVARAASRIAALAVAPAVLLGGCSSAQSSPSVVVRRADAQEAFHGAVLAHPTPVPDVTLSDTAGQRFALRSSPSRRVVLVFVGYSSCPDVCPGVLSDLAAALRRMPARERDAVEVIFVTTDPARDTPGVLDAYLQRFDPSFIGLTGAQADLRRAADGLGVTVEDARPLPSGGYEVGHGAQLVGIGADRQVQVMWPHGTTVDDLAHDLTLFARQQG